jgi:hypothetical protein
MKVVLLSTYDLGHQPFGLASPAAWLGEAGARVRCIDLAAEGLDEDAVREAGLIAVYLPMHTATRIAGTLVPRLKHLNREAHLCFYGLYAPLNEAYLRQLGAGTILGGEFESGLLSLYKRLAANGAGAPESQSEPMISLTNQRFRVPDRSGLADLSSYAYLDLGNGESRVAGYTEASRGCKHLCRHCPVVPVYGGRFHIVQRDVVMEDIRRQVGAGARHITFGDPDFFNGIGHALKLVEAFHQAFPDLTFDATIKVEHLLEHRRHLATLAATGCLFVTTAVESIDDDVLALLEKDHTRDDFIRAVALAREAGLTLSPTFIPFSPWTTLAGYIDLLELLAALDLIAHIAPIQLSIRLLVTEQSRLLEIPEIKGRIGDFDAAGLSYRWAHADPRVDALQRRVQQIVEQGEADGAARAQIFRTIWRAAADVADLPGRAPPASLNGASETPSPCLSEPWYCCAEPTTDQLAGV